MSEFLVVQTGAVLPELYGRLGDFPHWFRVALGLPRNAMDVVRVDTGEALPNPARYTGIIVTGSGAMVSERRDWSERTAAWLRDVVERDAAALLGVCYGHQLIAHARGGTVDWNPHGREIGTRAVMPTPAARDDPLFAPLPSCFRAQTTHRQSVIATPADAQVLARSELEPHQVMRFGARAWGVQFHPEFSAHAMAGYVRLRAETLRGEGLDAAHILAAVAPAPEGRRLLRRFARIARGG